MNSRDIIGSLCGLAGGAVGALLGYFAFRWIAGQGVYALAVPGTLLGLGWGWASRHRSYFDAAVCGFLALGLGIFSEWKFAPFVADDSFGFFSQAPPSTQTHYLDYDCRRRRRGRLAGCWPQSPGRNALRQMFSPQRH